MSIRRPDRRDVTPNETASAGTDDLAARLQARLAAIEASPDRAGTRSGGTRARHDAPVRSSGVHLSPGPAASPQASLADLHDQLEVLRGQLEDAFDDVEARLAAAQAQAEAADSRAQVASARAANILHAVDELAADLSRIAAASPADVPRLRSAVEKLRARLQPT